MQSWFNRWSTVKLPVLRRHCRNHVISTVSPSLNTRSKIATQHGTTDTHGAVPPRPVYKGCATRDSARPRRFANFISPRRCWIRNGLARYRISSMRKKRTRHFEFFPCILFSKWQQILRKLRYTGSAGPHDCLRTLPKTPVECCSSCGNRRATPSRFSRWSSCRTVLEQPSPHAGNNPANTGCDTRAVPILCPPAQRRSATNSRARILPICAIFVQSIIGWHVALVLSPPLLYQGFC